MKTTVFYYSRSGNTKAMAEVIAEGMQTVDGVEAKAFSIDEVDEAWAAESKCVVLGTPIYLASFAGAVKTWLEGPGGKLMGGKMGGAFATAKYVHGGGELGIQAILDHMLVLGMMTYSGGGAFGHPVIHLGPVAIDGHLEDYNETFKLYGQRMATKAKEIFG